MAGISTAIEIQDRVSGSLNRITASLYNTTSAFQDVDRASETTFNTSGVQAMTQELYAYEERIEQIESELVNANRRLQQMEEETEDVRQQASQLENAFGQIGSVIAGLGLGMLIKNQVSDAIDYASDLTEVQNVVDTVFGQNSAVDDWSKNMLDAVGLNELTAKQFAGTMGAMLSSSGVAQDKVEDMSMSITELAGDMASFYNLDAEDAFTKISSGISGETEPLRQLGINMSVANLEAYALSQGIETAYSEMDQATQTMLRYQYLMDATAQSQGDFARTSDSYSNQVKSLKENWTAFTGELATSVLPTLAYGVGLLNSFVGFMSKNWDVIGPIIAGLAGAAAVIAGVALAIKIASVATTIWNAVLAMNPVVLIVAGVVALIGAIMALCNWIANMTGAAQSGFGIITGGVNVVIQFFKNLGLTVANIALGIWNALGACADNMGIAFNNVICNIQSWFYSLLSTALTVVGGICEALNKLPFVEFDYSGITSKAEEYANKAAESSGNKKDYVSVGDAFSEGFNTFDTFQDGWVKSAFDSGAEWGDGVVDKVSNFFSGGTDTGSAYVGTGIDSIGNDLSGIAGDTSSIADSVDISNENLKYLRDIAERDVINRFTTAEIKVDMTNNNNINNSMDIDGIVDQLTLGVQEAMEYAAEGVHT